MSNSAFRIGHLDQQEPTRVDDERCGWTRARNSLRRRRQSRAPKRPASYGTATRHGREHLLRLLGVERLKREGLRNLSTIRQRLDATGEAQLLAAVAAQSPSAAVAAALGLPAPSAASSTTDSQVEGIVALDHGDAPSGTALVPGEPWVAWGPSTLRRHG